MREAYFKKIECAAPVFFGCLGALVFCALIAARELDLRPGFLAVPITDDQAGLFDGPDGKPVVTEGGNFFTKVKLEERDHIRESYHQPDSRELVIDFFTRLCPSREIAEAILSSADWFNIPPALAFALAWEESQLNPLAVNTKNRDGSIDRGLFQLNNRSFPHLELQAYFSPDVNSWHAMSHFRYCMDTGRTEIAALAMYNAGTGRVSSSGAPKSTLDYISRILDNKNKIEDSFFELKSWHQEQQIEIEALADIAEEKPDRPLLMPLKPLTMSR
ncbi:MAG: transglycosylase SLT domain-containing protein [Treponema sp.]|nr:transglycosylase SLT domain-containing protein [Treponema sp.]